MRNESIEPVVAGVDGTLAGVRAVDLAAEEATARVAPLVVVYTVEPGTDPALLRGHRRLLDLVVSRAQAEHPALSVASDLVYGEPVETLVRWSARACLVVVGHRDGRLYLDEATYERWEQFRKESCVGSPNELVIETDRVVNPAKEHIIPDPRDLGVRVSDIEWSNSSS